MAPELYKNLASKDLFLPLLDYFVTTSIEEQYEENGEANESKISYANFYEEFLKNVSAVNADNIFDFCTSPIERIFLASLMLLFIKNKMPCLFITSPFGDAENDIKNFINHYEEIDKFIETYKNQTGDTDLTEFDNRLREKQKLGKIPEDDVEDILMHKNLRKIFEWNSYHITPQAGFKNIKVDNKSIRVDFLIWIPGDPSIKFIVECDGFEYHKSKESFINDRIRDRLLQQEGYKVLRYSGSEINKNPVKISSDLFEILNKLDADKDKLRLL